MDKSSSLQKSPGPAYATLDDWILHEAIPFSIDSPQSFNASIDRVMASLGDCVKLLGLGEALHWRRGHSYAPQPALPAPGGEARLQRHCHREQFPPGARVNEYVAGRGPASYDVVQEAGFSHGFGRLDANRELVEWMR